MGGGRIAEFARAPDYCRVAYMKKVALVLLLAACSTKGEPAKDMPVVKGSTAKAGDPAMLPPAGTAPPAITVTKELDPMWNAKVKTLQGKDTTLAELKGKALMIV